MSAWTTMNVDKIVTYADLAAAISWVTYIKKLHLLLRQKA